MKWFKYIIISYLFAILAIVIIIASCNMIVIYYSKDLLYDNVKDIPYKEVGLLLGTSPSTTKGHTNIYYNYRIDAAVKLYKAKKIKLILISGDGKFKNYDETKYMKRDLVKRGIPANKIILDKKGLRTYDSVIRAKDVYGYSEFTVISQKFHNERAVFLAGHNDIDAIGFNAKDAPNQKGKSAQRMRIREIFAKVKVFVDLLR
jgi:SanA protein